MSITQAPLTADNYWTADQLRVMRGLALPAWLNPVAHVAQSIEPLLESQPEPAAVATAMQTVAHLPKRVIATHPVNCLIVLSGSAALTEIETLLLGHMLASVGYGWEQVHVLPLLGDGEHSDNPFSDIAQQGLHCVLQHVQSMQVKSIITMGELAAQTLIGVDDALASLGGEPHDYEGLPLIVMAHPADLLQLPALKAQAWRDLNLIFQTH